MSDARLRQLERELAADPTPARRDRLALERERAGDRTWLPVLARDLERWDEWIRFERLRARMLAFMREDGEVVLDVGWVGGNLTVAGLVDPNGLQLHDVSLVAPWVDPLAEARAAALEIELHHGVRTLAEVAAEQGLDWQALAEALALRGEDAR